MDTGSLIPTTARGWCSTDSEPMKDGEKHARYLYELKPRLLTVTKTERLSATLVRIRMSSDDGFAGFSTISPEDHIKLFFDRDANGEIILPQMTEGRWSPQGYTFRDYTVRWFDPEAGVVDLDFVLHDHGIAGRWARTAKPGDQLSALGPRGSMLVKDVFPWYVLAADETALPALARWLEGLRPGVPVTAYIEIAGPDSRIDLPTRADLTTIWLERGDVPAGTEPILSRAIEGHDFPNLDGFVWVAGEALGIKAARRHLKELGLKREHYDVDGYWRRGTINHDHHAPDDE